MEKIVRLTEHDLQRIVKRVIREKDNEINELGVGDVVDAGLKVGKKLGLDSDWAYVTQSFPGLSMIKPTYDVVKAFRTMQKQTFEENMEAIREYMGGIKGVVIAVALDTLAIGEVLNPALWGFYLNYDCWKWSAKKDLNITNIIMDIVGIVTAGAGAATAKEVKAVLGAELKVGVDVAVGMIASKAPKLFKYLSSIIKGSSSILQKAMTQATKGIAILSKKIPSMAKGLQGLKSGFSTMKAVLKQLEGALAKKIGKKGVHAGQHVVKHYTQHKVGHNVVASATGEGHGEGGHGGGHGEKHATPTTQNKQTIPRYITVNGVKKPNPKFKEKYGYA